MYEIKVLDIKQHGDSGHIEVTVCAVDGERQGPKKTYGIDPRAILSQHNGDVDLWLQTVKGRHQASAGLHDSVVAKLQAYKGKTL